MGRGAAKECRDMFPGIDRLAGFAIKQAKDIQDCYGVLFLPFGIGLFQVKRHFKDVADLKLIAQSSYMLGNYAKCNENIMYHVNFPGIGNGKRRFHEVWPLIKILPDNVSLWAQEDIDGLSKEGN
jgi:hypothetical protein